MPKAPRAKPSKAMSDADGALITDKASLLRAIAARQPGQRLKLAPEAAVVVTKPPEVGAAAERVWEELWDASAAGEEETVDLPLLRAKPGTSFYHLSVEGILSMVTEAGVTTEKRGQETRHVRYPLPQGAVVSLCLPDHRTPDEAEQAAQAIRVLQKVAGQCADAKRRRGRRRKGIWLTPEEVRVWNGLLRHQPTLQLNCYNPETHEREAHPGRENQVAGGHWPHPEAIFHTSLYLAAQFLAEVAFDRGGYRVARCRAPLHPANTDDKAVCGRLFVTATQGGVGQTCGDACRRRAADRKRAVRREANSAARKEAHEELLQRRREELQRPKG